MYVNQAHNIYIYNVSKIRTWCYFALSQCHWCYIGASVEQKHI